MNNVKTTLLYLLSIVILSACGGGGGSSKQDTPSSPTLDSISISSLTTNLKIGETQQLSATGVYSDTSSELITETVTWSSSNTSIASISETGLITSISAGSVTFTAALGGIQNTTQGLMITLNSISINKSNSNLKIGVTEVLTAIGTYTDSSTEDISELVLWISSNITIASVSQEGLLSSISAGTITIVASINDIEGSIQAEMIDLVDLSITPATLTIAKDSTQLFRVSGRYSDNSTEDVSSLVSWSFNTPGFANISDSGLLTSISAGTINLNANINSTSSSATVTISPAELKIITIRAPISIAAGIAEQLNATGTYSDGSSQDITSQVTWLINNSSLASINSSTGLFQSTQQGIVTVSASTNGVQALSTIEINEAILTDLIATPAHISIPKGRSSEVVIVAVFSDQSHLDVSSQVSWFSTNTNSHIEPNSNDIIADIVGSNTLTASLSDLTTSIEVTISDAELTNITIFPISVSIPKGLSQNFSASGLFSDGSIQDLTSQVTWISSDESINVMDNIGPNNGFTLGLEQGISTITAVLGDISTTTNLTISNATLHSIEIQPPTQTVASGFNVQIKAFGNYSDGAQKEITDIVEWSSSNIKLLDFSNSNTGNFNTLEEGNTIIHANLDSITGLGEVTVSAASLSSINIQNEITSIPNGHQHTLTAQGVFSDGSSKDISELVTWLSSDIAIIGLDNTVLPGQITALNIGSAEVSASLNNLDNTISVSVTNATLNSILITSEQSAINAKTNTYASALATYSDGSSKTVTQEVHWLSSDSNTASIDNSASNKGIINGLVTGSTIISASLDGISSNNIPIDVSQNPNTPIAISLVASPNLILSNGSDSTQLQATVSPAEQGGTISDTTQIEFTIIEGEQTRSEIVTTSNGIASIVLTSSYDGLISITANIVNEELNSSTALLSTTEFKNGLTLNANSNAQFANGHITQGSLFALFLRNLSNREFTITNVSITYNDPLVHLPDSPIVDTQYFSGGTLSAGEFTVFGYLLDDDLPSNALNIVYLLNDPSTNTSFIRGITFSF